MLFWGWYQSGNVGLAPKIIIFSVILSFFVLNNNAFLSDLNSLPHVLLNIIGLNFIWISRYQNSSWISKYFSIARSVYLFYAGYTILMYFIPALLEIPIAIFPSGAESLRLEYNSGCMPGFTNHYSTNGMLLACVKLWFSLFLCKCFFCCMDLLVIHCMIKKCTFHII